MISGNQRLLHWAALPHLLLPRTAGPLPLNLQGEGQVVRALVQPRKDQIPADDYRPGFICLF
jgi:hypothetical protein